MKKILTLLLPLLMAEILTGQKVHEWLGIGTFVTGIIVNSIIY